MPYALGRGACRVAFLAAAMLLAFAGPNAAQVVDQLTVVGRPGKLPATLSYSVGYADLDLRTKAGRVVLAKRIDVAATYVCRTLASGDASASLAACYAKAMSDAMAKAHAAQTRAMTQRANWRPGPAWTPPPIC